MNKVRSGKFDDQHCITQLKDCLHEFIAKCFKLDDPALVSFACFLYQASQWNHLDILKFYYAYNLERRMGIFNSSEIDAYRSVASRYLFDLIQNMPDAREAMKKYDCYSRFSELFTEEELIEWITTYMGTHED
jgi:hypothetical protein